MKVIRPLTIDDAALVASSVPETVPLWDVLETYAEGELVRLDDTHRLYESQVDDNTGHDPRDTPQWVDIGPTNRWAMFDEEVGTIAAAPESIEVSIHSAAISNSIALLDISGRSVRIVASTLEEGVLRDKSFSLLSTVGITDYWAWCFEPPVMSTLLIVSDLPSFTGVTLTVTVENEGGMVEIGTCVVGKMLHIGGTRFGTRLGIRDFSTKFTNRFGVTHVVKRGWSKRASFSVIANNDDLDVIYRFAADHSGRPVVCIGSERFESTVIYGLFPEWEMEITYPQEFLLTAEMEGFI